MGRDGEEETDEARFKKKTAKLKRVSHFAKGPDGNPMGDVQACQLDFAVSFAFKSTMHSYLAQRFFDDVIIQNVNAFLNQARAKYGPPSEVQ